MTRTLLGLALLVAAALSAILLIGAGALLGPGPTEPGPTASRPTPTPRRSTPTPVPTPIDLSVVASAVVVPARSADLAMQITGLVAAIPVKEEQMVVADQLVLALDASTRQAAMTVATADVRRAEAALERAEIQLELVPDDASPAQLESAQAELRLAQAELTLARSALAEAEVALRQTELRAPFAGTVVRIEVSEGEQALAGETLITIADLSAWFLETTDLGELDVVRIAVGDRATITFEALPELTLSGTVDRINARGTAQQGGVRFDVVIAPDEHHPELLWNLTATVSISPGD